MTQKRKRATGARLRTLLGSPWTLVAAMVLGVVISQFAKPILPLMDAISTIYMRLLQMCVIPIVVCAVTVNIGNLLRGGSRKTLARWLALMLTALFLFTAVAVGVSALFEGALKPDAKVQAMLADLSGASDTDAGNYVKRIAYAGEHNAQAQPRYSLIEFLYSLFPSNVFASLAGGDMLPILMFFLVLGVMLTLLAPAQSAPVYRAFDGIYAAMNRLIGYILAPFPIAMMAMLAQQFSSEGVFDLIGSLIPLVLVVLGVLALLCAATFLVVQWSTKCSVREHLLAVKRTFFVAVGTSSCMATVSVALEDACEHLKIKPQLAKSVLPISISMCQPGVAASVAVAAVYGMLIYGVPLNVSTVTLVMICPVVFSLAVIGVPGVVAVSMLTIVLEPLYIPSALIITIYLAIVPIVNPLVVFSSVYANFGIASILNRALGAPGPHTTHSEAVHP